MSRTTRTPRVVLMPTFFEAVAFLGTWAAIFFGILDSPQIKSPTDYYLAGGVTVAFVVIAVVYAARGRHVIEGLGGSRTILKLLMAVLLLTLAATSLDGLFGVFGEIRTNPNFTLLPEYILKFIGFAFASGACLAALILLNNRLRDFFRRQYAPP